MLQPRGRTGTGSQELSERAMEVQNASRLTGSFEQLKQPSSNVGNSSADFCKNTFCEGGMNTHVVVFT